MAKHYCVTCHRWFHPLGIARHRSMHYDKRESCTIILPDVSHTRIFFLNKSTAAEEEEMNTLKHTP